MASAQPRQIRHRVREVAKFFKRDGSYEAAIIRPDVIGFAQPLIASASEETPSDEQLKWAAANGINSLDCQPSNLERFSQLMIYPAVVLFASVGIYVGLAFFIAPQFEQMFEEFGLELPAATNLLLGSARFVRSFGWLVAILMTAMLVLAFVWLLLPGAIISRIKFLKNLFENKRRVMADLASHTARLRRMGLPANQAFAAANFAAGLSNRKPDEVIGEAATIRTPGYHLLELALQQPVNHANDRMLVEVADNYRRRTTTIGDWWIHWLVYLLQCFIILGVLFMVASLFMPLFSIVSGLTG